MWPNVGQIFKKNLSFEHFSKNNSSRARPPIKHLVKYPPSTGGGYLLFSLLLKHNLVNKTQSFHGLTFQNVLCICIFLIKQSLFMLSIWWRQFLQSMFSNSLCLCHQSGGHNLYNQCFHTTWNIPESSFVFTFSNAMCTEVKQY